MPQVAAAKDFQVPALTGPVVDDAGILPAQTRAQLDRLLRSLHDSGGSQINVLTLSSLQGYEIEDASIKIVDQWKLGDKKLGNGVLLIVAPNEHRVRIEVGRGLEGSLTDVETHNIIDDEITPRFKQGDFAGGVSAGVIAIIQKTDPQFLENTQSGDVPQVATQPKAHVPVGVAALLIYFIFHHFGLFLILLFLLLPRVFGGRRYYGGGGWWGGGGGWGSGGGGGGWSGGGGGFNGGGSSGSW